MLKKLTAAAGVLCILAATLCATVSAEDESTKTCTFPRVPDGSINVLDTQLDDLYQNFEMQEMVEQNLHAWPDALQTTTGKFWGCYDSEYLYLYIEITDTGVIDYTHEDPTQTWNRESIGVIMDFDYLREEEYEYNYAENGDRICYFNLAGDFNNVGYHMYAPDSDTGLYNIIQSSTVKDTGDGRILYELALPFPDDVKVEEGLKFGFEVCAPNADNGERNSVISWSPEGQDMWKWTRCCGTAFLGAEIAEEAADVVDDGAASTESTPVTADAGIVAAAAVMAVAAGVVLNKKR